MRGKIRVKLQIKSQLGNTKSRFYKVIEKIFPQEILNFISKGISPVSNQRKYQKYSDSYKTAIKKGYVDGKKKRSPVDLKQSGDLHDSLETSITNRGVKFEFKDEKAKYHDIEGAGKKKVIRRLLPNTGNRENENFNNRLLDIIKKVFEKQLERINRQR